MNFHDISKKLIFVPFSAHFSKKSKYFEKLLLDISQKTIPGVKEHAGSIYEGFRTFRRFGYPKNHEKPAILSKNRFFDRQHQLFSKNKCYILKGQVEFH
jgi:hypothetical protein